MKVISWGIAIIAILFSFYVLWESYDPLHKEEKGPAKTEEKPIVIQGLELYEYETGKVKWRFFAERGELFKEKKQTFLYQFRGKLYQDSSSEKTVQIRSRLATIHEDLQLTKIEGDVLIDFNDGRKLQTEELWLDQKKEVLYGEKKVLINGPEGKMEGSSIRYDLKTELLQLTDMQLQISI